MERKDINSLLRHAAVFALIALCSGIFPLIGSALSNQPGAPPTVNVTYKFMTVGYGENDNLEIKGPRPFTEYFESEEGQWLEREIYCDSYSEAFDPSTGFNIERLKDKYSEILYPYYNYLNGDRKQEPKRLGDHMYKFVGLFTEPELQNLYTVTPDADITLYAAFQHVPIYPTLVTFDVNGGIHNVETLMYATKYWRNYPDENWLLTEPEAPTREGYIFDGWYTDKDGGTKWNFAESTGNAGVDDFTLYAHWILESDQSTDSEPDSSETPESSPPQSESDSEPDNSETPESSHPQSKSDSEPDSSETPESSYPQSESDSEPDSSETPKSSQPQPESDILLMRLYSSTAILNGKTIAVDTTNKDVAPFTLMTKTMVPVRFVENIGAKVKYTSAAEPVTVTHGDTTLTLEFGNPVMKKEVKGKTPEEIKLPTAPTLVEGKTCVPIREIAEGIGFFVMYNSADYTITVSSVQDPPGTTLPPMIPFQVARSIKAAKTSFASKVGESIQLLKSNIIFDPADVVCDKLLYSSDNEAVATVTSQGKIKAIGSGIAKVTIKSHNGKETFVTVTVQ